MTKTKLVFEIRYWLIALLISFMTLVGFGPTVLMADENDDFLWMVIPNIVANAKRGGAVKPPSDGLTALERELLNRHNAARSIPTFCGGNLRSPVPALTWNNKLANAARAHSTDMRDNNFFDHTGSNGSSPGARITLAGYSWTTFGENIAFGYTSAMSVTNGLLGSTGHCNNIMNGQFIHMGAAEVDRKWTFVFARGG